MPLITAKKPHIWAIIASFSTSAAKTGNEASSPLYEHDTYYA